jgi:hypothetical protein
VTPFVPVPDPFGETPEPLWRRVWRRSRRRSQGMGGGRGGDWAVRSFCCARRASLECGRKGRARLRGLPPALVEFWWKQRRRQASEELVPPPTLSRDTTAQPPDSPPDSESGPAPRHYWANGAVWFPTSHPHHRCVYEVENQT